MVEKKSPITISPERITISPGRFTISPVNLGFSKADKSKAKIQGNEGPSVHRSKLRNEWEQTLTGFIIMTVNRPGEIVNRSFVLAAALYC